MNGLENYFNAKTYAGHSNDMIKDVPSLKSLTSTLNEKGFKEQLEKQYKGKWQLEKAYNKKKILMPQDSKGLVLIYGGVKEEQKRRKLREENGHSLDGQKRSNSMQAHK